MLTYYLNWEQDADIALLKECEQMLIAEQDRILLSVGSEQGLVDLEQRIEDGYKRSLAAFDVTSERLADAFRAIQDGLLATAAERSSSGEEPSRREREEEQGIRSEATEALDKIQERQKLLETQRADKKLQYERAKEMLRKVRLTRSQRSADAEESKTDDRVSVITEIPSSAAEPDFGQDQNPQNPPTEHARMFNYHPSADDSVGTTVNSTNDFDFAAVENPAQEPDAEATTQEHDKGRVCGNCVIL
ncbi:MAG: hypothetical protein V3V61_07445 [Gammaproteobacteria bacterium]